LGATNLKEESKWKQILILQLN